MRIPPRATYRLQLRAGGFGFADAIAALPYIAALGASHVYLSPILRATAGSQHGYDVVDPEAVDPALGGEAGFAALAAAVRAMDMGILLDIVPNHMSIAGTDNRWWRDVLENGAASYFAEAFDVDWAEGGDRVLLPVLGERYGRAIATGAIHVRRGDDGVFEIHTGDQRFPVAPRSLAPVVRAAATRDGAGLAGAARDELEFIADALARLPASRERDQARRRLRHRDRGVLLARIDHLIASDPAVARAVADELDAINRDPLALDALLEGQNYRLAHWSVARDRALTHRRFFDVTSLVGVRVEDPDVFAAGHRRVLGWLADGTIDGVRVDHVDGLRDPTAYLAALRAASPDAWIVVEKIVATGETVPAAWPIDGTTGYEHADAIAALLVDPSGATRLTSAFEAYTGVAWDVAAARRRARADVLADALHSELVRVAQRAFEVCAASPACRDYTHAEIETVLVEILAGYPVYRTYLPEVGDRGSIDAAVAAARAARADLDSDLVGMIAQALAFEVPSAPAQELACVVQQVTGPIVAKGDEDTLAYRLVAVAARCEVGSDSDRLAGSIDDTHARLAAGSARGLLASSTHDSKRGEDTRARMLALADGEHVEAWLAAIEGWRARAEAGWGGVEPDRALEYLMWQTLVGAWPIDEARARAYAEKASREACVRTSWRAPNPAYEAARDRWLAGVFADRELCDDVAAFAARVAPAGERNVLAMTLVKLTAPGVPDFYQGSELAAFTLVDPDNRQRVDLAALARAKPAGSAKLRLIRRVLALRAREPELFDGAYRALSAVGPHADRVFAYARGDRMIAIAARAAGSVEGHVALPAGTWLEVITGRDYAGAIPLADVAPVALLVRR